MYRRDLLRLAGLAGLHLSLLGPWENAAKAAFIHPKITAPIGSPPLFIHLHAYGGWDPTLFCDPKPDLNLSYEDDRVRSIGNVSYVSSPSSDYLFEKYINSILVINGIDAATNDHVAGTRHFASGRLQQGHPNIAALVAGCHAPQFPMAYQVYGLGYHETSGVVATTRAHRSRIDELSFPERTVASSATSPPYHLPENVERLQRYRQERAERVLDQQSLRRYQSAIGSMMVARAGANQLRKLQDVLPPPAASPIQQQVQLMVAGYKASVSIGGSLSVSGYDTHADHDALHVPRMADFLDILVFLLEEAERQGVADDLLVLVTSEFGRHAAYNPSGGKDHWPITSALVCGGRVQGNRVIGGTDENLHARLINPITLELTDDPDMGMSLTPAHLHDYVRRLAGIHDCAVAARFPLEIGAAVMWPGV